MRKSRKSPLTSTRRLVAATGGSWDRTKPGKPRELGTFNATPGWEDVFVQKRIDMGNFYASKDNEYPTTEKGIRQDQLGMGDGSAPEHADASS